VNAATTNQHRALYAALPKIELHRHLEGSIRLSTLIDVAREYQIDLPAYDMEALRQYVQITPGSPANSAHFLSKFAVIRRFFCAPEVIQRIAREAVEDAAADNVKYMELRFTPKALTNLKHFSFGEVVRWVCAGVQEGQAGRDIRVRLILSMNRHESVIEGERTLRVALEFRDKGVVALDLAGQEAGYSAEPFYSLFKEGRQSGLELTVHAGEWFGPRNIREAIEKMGTKRVGHGVRIVEDSTVVQIAREAGTTFEVCPTSNVQSGVVKSAMHHPLRDMNQLGLKTTINTDDPSISNITLTDELMLATSALGLTLDDVKQSILTAAASTFLPDSERAALVNYFTDALALAAPHGEPNPVKPE
jgi:adenosine deaminase